MSYGGNSPPALYTLLPPVFILCLKINRNILKIITKILVHYINALYLYNIKITQKQNAMKTLIDYTNKANELNTKYPNLKAEVTETWDGKPQITVCNSDKAKTLTEMYPTFKFNF